MRLINLGIGIWLLFQLSIVRGSCAMLRKIGLKICFQNSIDDHPLCLLHLRCPQSPSSQRLGSISNPQAGHVQRESVSLVDDWGRDVYLDVVVRLQGVWVWMPCSSLKGLGNVASNCGPRRSCGLELWKSVDSERNFCWI